MLALKLVFCNSMSHWLKYKPSSLAKGMSLKKVKKKNFKGEKKNGGERKEKKKEKVPVLD